MRLALLAAPLWLAACRASLEPRTVPEPGLVVERRVELATKVELLRSDTLVDGRKDPPAIAALMLASFNAAYPETGEVWELVDEVLAVDEHGPREIARTYRALDGVYFATPLVSLRWDGAEDGTVLRLVRGADPGEAGNASAARLAAWVPFDLDGRGLLPPGDATPGDVWTAALEDLPAASRVGDLESWTGAEVRCRLVAAEGPRLEIAFEVEEELVADGAVGPGGTDWVAGKEIELDARRETKHLAGRGRLVWDGLRGCAELVSCTLRHTTERQVRGRRGSQEIQHTDEMAFTTRLDGAVEPGRGSERD